MAPDSSTTGDGVCVRLQHGLRAAMKARDTAAVKALRGALAAIANAEAVDASYESAVPRGSGPIAGAVSGLGAGEVARRDLAESDVVALVQREIEDRAAAAREYERLGRTVEAAELHAQCAALRAVVGAA
jgi:hypothetical protein